jgi:hypothetical protein
VSQLKTFGLLLNKQLQERGLPEVLFSGDPQADADAVISLVDDLCDDDWGEISDRTVVALEQEADR